MSTIKFINPSLFCPEVSSYIKDGSTRTNIDIKSVFTSNGKKRNICRINSQISEDAEAAAIFSAASIIDVSHVNSLIEKYHNITTTFNPSSPADVEAASSIYYIVAIPYNGAIVEMNVTADGATVVNAASIKTESFVIGPKANLMFAKIAYLIIKAANADKIPVEFTCLSFPKNEDGSVKKVSRKLSMEISSEKTENIIPTVVNIKTEVAAEHETLAEFSSLFNLSHDKVIKDKGSKDFDANKKREKSTNNESKRFEGYTNQIRIKDSNNNGGNNRNRRGNKKGKKFNKYRDDE